MSRPVHVCREGMHGELLADKPRKVFILQKVIQKERILTEK